MKKEYRILIELITILFTIFVGILIIGPIIISHNPEVKNVYGNIHFGLFFFLIGFMMIQKRYQIIIPVLVKFYSILGFKYNERIFFVLFKSSAILSLAIGIIAIGIGLFDINRSFFGNPVLVILFVFILLNLIFLGFNSFLKLKLFKNRIYRIGYIIASILAIIIGFWAIRIF